MQNENLKRKISAILFLYNDPISVSKIKDFLDEENIEEKQIIEALKGLEVNFSDVGLTIIKSENTKEEKNEYAISIKNEFSDIAKKIKEEEVNGELTPASLQVLTICAYLNSPTKNEISFIRGVGSSQSIRALSSRGLIKKDGDRYGLSIEAMQKLGISNVKDLPEYEKIKSDFEERLKHVLQEEE